MTTVANPKSHPVDFISAIDGITQRGTVADPLVVNGAGIPATVVPNHGAWTDGSGTITAGGTAQNALAANAGRLYLMVQNVHQTEDLWFNVGAAAVVNQPSIRLVPGAMWEAPFSFVPTGAVSVIAATTGHAWTAKEF